MSSITSTKTTVRSAALAALLAALMPVSGCATFWAVNGGNPFEEKVRSEVVPEGSVEETLHITLFPAGAPPDVRTTTANASQSNGGAQAGAVAQVPAPTLQCRLSQSGDETEHRSYRLYGSKWKKTAAIAFVAEAALAAAYLLKESPEVSDSAFGAYMAADALGTGVLAFFPQRDKFRTSRSRESLDIHQLCPPRLNIELAGRRIAVERDGGLEENAGEYLREHFERSLGPVVVHLDVGARGQFQSRIELNQGVVCGWARSTNHPDAMRFCQSPSNGNVAVASPVQATDRVSSILFVSPGTLSLPARERQ